MINEIPYMLAMSDFVPATEGTKHSHNPQNRLHVILRSGFFFVVYHILLKLNCFPGTYLTEKSHCSACIAAALGMAWSGLIFPRWNKAGPAWWNKKYYWNECYSCFFSTIATLKCIPLPVDLSLHKHRFQLIQIVQLIFRQTKLSQALYFSHTLFKTLFAVFLIPVWYRCLQSKLADLEQRMTKKR